MTLINGLSEHLQAHLLNALSAVHEKIKDRYWKFDSPRDHTEEHDIKAIELP